MASKHYVGPVVVILYVILLLVTIFFFSGSSVGPSGQITLVESIPKQGFANLIYLIIVFAIAMGIVLELCHRYK